MRFIWLATKDKVFYEIFAIVLGAKVKKDIFLLILKKEDKKSLALFTDIFADVTISKLINKNFVPVIVFFENKDSYPLELFYTQNFPSIFLVSADDESYLKKPLMGIFDAVELKNLLL